MSNDPWSGLDSIMGAIAETAPSTVKQKKQREKVIRKVTKPKGRERTGRSAQMNFKLTPKLKAAVRKAAGKEYGAIAELMEAALMAHPKVRAALGIEEGDE